jgi:hypothetical protein
VVDHIVNANAKVVIINSCFDLQILVSFKAESSSTPLGYDRAEYLITSILQALSSLKPARHCPRQFLHPNNASLVVECFLILKGPLW